MDRPIADSGRVGSDFHSAIACPECILRKCPLNCSRRLFLRRWLLHFFLLYSSTCLLYISTHRAPSLGVSSLGVSVIRALHVLQHSFGQVNGEPANNHSANNHRGIISHGSHPMLTTRFLFVLHPILLGLASDALTPSNPVPLEQGNTDLFCSVLVLFCSVLLCSGIPSCRFLILYKLELTHVLCSIQERSASA